MEKENLHNHYYIKLSEELNYLSKKYEDAKKEYESIDVEWDNINSQLIIMLTLHFPEEHIIEKEEKLKETEERLFNINETMKRLLIEKVQKYIEIQEYTKHKTRALVK